MKQPRFVRIKTPEENTRRAIKQASAMAMGGAATLATGVTVAAENFFANTDGQLNVATIFAAVTAACVGGSALAKGLAERANTREELEGILAFPEYNTAVINHPGQVIDGQLVQQ